MSNSVVKITDSPCDDSLLLLVGEDGSVAPNKDLVQAFLGSREGSTNLQVMHMKKCGEQTINLSVDNLVYVPDDKVSSGTSVVETTGSNPVVEKPSPDQLARILRNVNLDHDYTQHVEEEVDELAKTLRILDGGSDERGHYEKPIIVTETSKLVQKVDDSKLVKLKKRSVEEKVDSEEAEWDDKVKKTKKVPKIEFKPKPKEPPSPKVEKSPEPRKIVKKDKRPSKTMPDDFALFSTPDIIRRVGKDALISPPTQELFPESKKIEIRSKSTDSFTPHKAYLDNKLVKIDNKSKEVKQQVVLKNRRNTFETAMLKKNEGLTSPTFPEKPIDVDDTLRINEDVLNGDQNLALDGAGLDLDPSLLDNINNDIISDDILLQVAQSLVSNTVLQNAIAKTLNEENLDLNAVPVASQDNINQPRMSQVPSTAHQKGTQIVRPDGRVVLIPPPERPTTRSRNKPKEVEKGLPKFVRKPLDEEHVSGNELDSSGEGEEESEDDPNKLWCTCNQPHNNRFMICCDTCEEWYHGKCVNITKAMGQQMESEGKEWICVFCKDPKLKRPNAAARRIRKASRNSRHSSESASSVKTEPSTSSSGSVPCVVCQKPSRSNSIFCSENCILAHAQGVERVVVFERSTGNMLTGNRAPSAASLEQFLKTHPGYEVVRSAGKIVTTKTHNPTHTKVKVATNIEADVFERAKSFKEKISQYSKVIQQRPGNSNVKIIERVVSATKIRPSVTKDPPVTPVKAKLVANPVKTPVQNVVNKEKTPIKPPRLRQVAESSPSPHAKQENIRENVHKTLFEQLTNRLKLVDDLKLSESELKSISTEIESQLFKCFGDTGQKYRNKYRSLIFNIKDIKNQTLWRRICEKSINPYQLVRLSPDDLASQELALWREREAKHQLDMIKKSELELLNCTRQYVMKTHKGEQILEDNNPTQHLDNSEVITTLTDNSTGEKSDNRKDTLKEHDRKGGKRSHKDKNRERSQSKDTSSHKSVAKEHENRKRTSSPDRSSKHSVRKRSRSRSRGRDKHKRSSHKSSRHKKDAHRGSSTEKLDKKSKEILEQLVDNKIVPPLEDRLWTNVPQEEAVAATAAESDSDHEPTSTVTIPTPPRNSEFEESGQNSGESKDGSTTKDKNESDDSEDSFSVKPSEAIWKGVINMIDVAQIAITAHEVSGDCSGLGLELPPQLDIVGRISPETVWDYIGKMKSLNNKVISVVRLNAINSKESMAYLALYTYLSSRNRLGVVKSTNKAVKDFYILPLAPQKPIPQVLLPLNGPGFEEARPNLLLGIIVRDRRKRPIYEPQSSASGKKSKADVTGRSYTPPPVKDPRLTKLPLPLSTSGGGTEPQDDDEPYSPEDSDPDGGAPTQNTSSSFLEDTTKPSQTFEPFANKFSDIPGLDNPPLPSDSQEIQRQMEKLNKEIEMQKSEINSISQNLATESTEIGQSALANIALPSNLQQILDSIKTIGSVTTSETLDVKPSNPTKAEASDFTIPLMLPTSFTRQNTDNTIPLNIPAKKKSTGQEKAPIGGVLSSLTEQDLIRKAEEMLGAPSSVIPESTWMETSLDPSIVDDKTS